MTLDGIQWLADDELFEMGYGVLFARGLEPLDLIDLVGGESIPGPPLSRSSAAELELRIQETTKDQVARFGSLGEWAFVFTENGPIGDDFLRVATVVSVRTDVVSLSHSGGGVRWFAYARNGEMVCQFEPGMDLFLTGTGHRGLLDAFESAGLVARQGEPVGAGLDLDLAELRTLQIAESIFSLSLPGEEIIYGDLPAARIPRRY